MSDPADVARYKSLAPDSDWVHFASGIPIWIAQTYLRLSASGIDVALSAQGPAEGIVIVHADDLHAYFRAPGFSERCFIVCVRADRHPQIYSDLEIVQNAGARNSRYTVYIPHWPQPGLIPRERSRGSCLHNIAFKGGASESHSMFEELEWTRFLNDQRLCWNADKMVWCGPKPQAYDSIHWNDYSNTDLIIAIRNNTSNLYINKPASKLVNAWLAGVPAILGPEVAYRELRKSSLDYIEASSLSEVIDGILLLRKDPQLYLAMVQNGLERSVAFQSQAVIQKWQTLLKVEIPTLQTKLKWPFFRYLPLSLRYRIRLVCQKHRKV